MVKIISQFCYAADTKVKGFKESVIQNIKFAELGENVLLNMSFTIVNISPSASGKVAITVKVGELLCQEIRDANFMFALKKRSHTIKYF
jgi:hypothetical protein